MVGRDQHRSGLETILAQQSRLESTWHWRAPLLLLQAHAECVEALWTVGDFLLAVEGLEREDLESVTRLVHSIREVLTLFQRVKAFPEVEELFGAVAAEPVQVGWLAFPSANHATLFMAKHYEETLNLGIRFGPLLLDWKTLSSAIAKMSKEERIRQLTAKEIAQFVSSPGFSLALIDHWLGRVSTTEVSDEEIHRLEAPARQEFFRAWQRFYPLGSKYKTLADAVEDQQRRVVDVLFEPHRRGRRPAYARDHRWLSWHEQEKLGPAKIRDKWDGLPDEERRAICPTAWEKVGGDDPKTQACGREIVKTALKKAQQERMTQTNRRA